MSKESIYIELELSRTETRDHYGIEIASFKRTEAPTDTVTKDSVSSVCLASKEWIFDETGSEEINEEYDEFRNKNTVYINTISDLGDNKVLIQLDEDSYDKFVCLSKKDKTYLCIE